MIGKAVSATEMVSRNSSFRLSSLLHQCRSHWTDFHEI